MSNLTSRVEQIVLKLRKLINTKAFDTGRLPPEPDLANQLVVSRTTIRQALTQLEIDGLILRKHGVGTFVNDRVLNIGTRLEEVWDFVEMIKVSGHTPAVRNIFLRLEQASPIMSEKLALATGDEILITANVFMADNLPVIYCVDAIPAKLVRNAYHNEELWGPVYSFLKKRCDQQVEYNITKIVPVIADKNLQELLLCKANIPLHYFEEVAFNSDDLPIMFSQEYYRPEYFSFNVIRKMTTRQ
jgi:GntR family transcriptional regulator